MLMLFCLIFGIIFVICGILLSFDWWICILLCILGFIFAIFLMFLSAFIILLCSKRKDFVIKPKRVYGFYIKMICRFLIDFFRIKIICEGLDLIEDLNGYEIVSNHQSIFDPMLMILKSKHLDIGFLMKKEVLHLRFIGEWLKNGGNYCINRSNNREALKMVLNAVEAVKAPRPIGVFVEGTRSKGPNINKFRDGAFKIALKAKSPLVICVVDNTYNIHKRFPFRSTKVLFKVCRVLQYEEFASLNTKEIDTIVRNEMEIALSEARNKYNNYLTKK